MSRDAVGMTTTEQNGGSSQGSPTANGSGGSSNGTTDVTANSTTNGETADLLMGNGVPASGAIVPGGPNGPDGTIIEEVRKLKFS